nr:lysophospholipase [Lachnospiraceae bacterium]
MKRLLSIFLVLLLGIYSLTGCGSPGNAAEETVFDYSEIPLERNGIILHLDRISVEGEEPVKDILLIHGVTYSSNEFDTDYKDYSLVRKLAKEGYNVWRLDIAGFGQSGQVDDGFMPDSDYAAKDI